MKKDYEIESK